MVWDVDNPGQYTERFVNTSAFIPLALKKYAGLSGTLFYDPLDFWEGAYGLTVGPSVGSPGFTYYTSYNYYFLLGRVPTWPLVQQALGAVGLAQFQNLLQQPNGGNMQAFLQQHGEDLAEGFFGL